MNTSNFFRHCFIGNLLQRAYCFGWVWGVKYGCAGDENFRAGANKIGDIFRNNAAIHFDPIVVTVTSAKSAVDGSFRASWEEIAGRRNRDLQTSPKLDPLDRALPQRDDWRRRINHHARIAALFTRHRQRAIQVDGGFLMYQQRIGPGLANGCI